MKKYVAAAILVVIGAVLGNYIVDANLINLSPVPPYQIEVYDFRWTHFPLKVQVDLNQYTQPSYVSAVREALDCWVKSIQNYSQTYSSSIPAVNYVLYVSTINFTGDYDVLVTFTPDKLSTEGAVGTATSPRSEHKAVSPAIINITTYSATASNFFVKALVMHEFGHVLGIGHANSTNTFNGPELMYRSISEQQIYPSTLDVYALDRVYGEVYDQTVQLPQNISYVMIGEISNAAAHFAITFSATLLLIIIALAAVRSWRKNRRLKKTTQKQQENTREHEENS